MGTEEEAVVCFFFFMLRDRDEKGTWIFGADIQREWLNGTPSCIQRGECNNSGRSDQLQAARCEMRAASCELRAARYDPVVCFVEAALFPAFLLPQ